jgi:hypothetical protein
MEEQVYSRNSSEENSSQTTDNRFGEEHEIIDIALTKSKSFGRTLGEMHPMHDLPTVTKSVHIYHIFKCVLFWQ